MQLDFLGIGVQKAGTSTLHDILMQHSQIYLPAFKELHFFDNTEKFEKGLQWAQNTMFANYNNQKIKGEFTPDYIFFDKAPERIYKTLGKNIKFIVVFRNPVDRAVSQYLMTYRRGLEKQDFFSAIANEKKKTSGSETALMNFSYMQRGCYAMQLKRYLQYFPQENFLFFLFEKDIQHNLHETVKKIQSFLRADFEPLETNIVSNEAYTPRSLKLNRFFRDSKTFRTIARTFFKTEVAKKKVAGLMYNLNKSGKKNQQFKLDKQQKDELFQQYFLNDTIELEQMLHINFRKEWNYE